MKKYEREKYRLKAYKEEMYRLDTFNPRNRIELTEYNENWEPLLKKAKDLAERGIESSIWCLKYEIDI